MRRTGLHPDPFASGLYIVRPPLRYRVRQARRALRLGLRRAYHDIRWDDWEPAPMWRANRTAFLDAMTFADPTVRERLDHRDEAISSDEMWSRVSE